MAKKKRKGSKSTQIGGVNISGISGGKVKTGDISANVTAGGDVVGGDKITTFNQSHQKVGKQVNVAGDYKEGSTINAGKGSVIGSKAKRDIITNVNSGVSTADIAKLFAPIYQQVEAQPGLSNEDVADIKAEIKEIEAEIKETPTDIDDSFLARRLRNIKRIAPDILDVIAAIVVSPTAGLAIIWSKIRGKAQEMSNV